MTLSLCKVKHSGSKFSQMQYIEVNSWRADDMAGELWFIVKQVEFMKEHGVMT